MSQTFSALQSGTTTFSQLYGIVNNNIDAVRSNWAGTSAPGSPVTGQPFYNTSTGDYTLWNGSAWVDISAASSELIALSAEIVAARGTTSSLNTRLSVSINDDGTLKSTTTSGSWWSEETDTVTYVNSTTFTVSGDKTAIYLVGRALHLTQTTDDYGHVSTVSYNSSSGLTTITTDATVDSGLTTVEYGQSPLNDAKRTTTITIAEGGTGATTATAARTALGLVIGTNIQSYDAYTAKTNVAQAYSKTQSSAGGTLSISSGVVAWNMENYQYAVITLDQNVSAFTPSNYTAYSPYMLIVKQDTTGGYTLDLSSFLWPDGEEPDIPTAANAVTILSFISDGTNIYGWGTGLAWS